MTSSVLMEILWSKRGYFGILGDTHIFYYPIISYLRIKFYRVETMDMGRLLWNNGVSGNAIVSMVAFIVRYKILW